MSGPKTNDVEKFRWTMLVEAAEAWQGSWEPWSWTHYYFKDLDDGQRMELVRSTLRSLYHDGFIRFFRYPAHTDQDSSRVPDTLTPQEVNALLAAGSQLVQDPSYPDADEAPAVWFDATKTGAEQVARLSESQILPTP